MANDVQPLNLHTKSIGVKAILLVFSIFMLLLIVGPLIWLAIHAFAVEWLFPSYKPTGWTLDWFRKVFEVEALVSAMKTSLIISPIVVMLSAVICLPAAYASARYNYWGRRTFLIAMFASNAFPKIGLFATIATLYYFLNLMGTVVGVIIVQVLGTIIFMTWIPAAAFAAVPKSLEDAARDAGASKFRVFRTITLRMAMPGILVAMVMSFIYSFDEAQGTFLVGAPSIYTMPTSMYAIVETYPVQVTAVFSILLTIPSVFLISLARKHIIGGQLAEGFQIK
ncbi:MAG: ABC transporter permease subunit [Acidobacteria bacterium]|nr:ABC transporter permease subunit [Acidobacteriota bacterium]